MDYYTLNFLTNQEKINQMLGFITSLLFLFCNEKHFLFSCFLQIARKAHKDRVLHNMWCLHSEQNTKYCAGCLTFLLFHCILMVDYIYKEKIMVTIYSKNNCVQCKMTKRFLEQHKVNFKEINLDEQPEFIDHIKGLGFSAAPVIETVSEAFSGFQPAKLKALV